jgi:hypothetical protein
MITPKPFSRLVGLFIVLMAQQSFGQVFDQAKEGAAPVTRPVAPAKEEPAKDDEEVATVPRPEATPVDPRFIRLHLLDGSIIAGELSVESITVKTEFGDLKVPVEKIKSFTPGLDSKPELLAKIDKLFDDLGSDDYQTRESARKEIIAFGLKIRNELERHGDDGNAERKRHLETINKEFEELEDEVDEFEDDNVEKPWIRGDTVATTDFTIVGRIAQDSFSVTSKYGPLNVNLSDVDLADRPVGDQPEMRKSLAVDGSNLVQRDFKSAGIQIEKGDRISVRADGQLTMSPWGSNTMSTPDGGANYGFYLENDIYGGALVARIGSKGKVFKVGSRSTFTAKQSGVLQFAIAMQDQYANQGYNYPGQYNVRVKVQPK